MPVYPDPGTRIIKTAVPMPTRKLEIACPTCGSPDVVYSCTPSCCFNHVCSHCTTTFQPITAATGAKHPPITPPDPLPDCTDPTVACARCDSTAVYLTPEDKLVCSACRAVLQMELSDICPG